MSLVEQIKQQLSSGLTEQLSSVLGASGFKTDLTDTFSKLTETLSGVKDASSAEAALPKLQELDNKLDSAKATMQKLAGAGKAALSALVKTSEGKLKELIEKVLAIPGVGEKVKEVAGSIITKLTDLGQRV
jgi:archaellum component FlaC